MLFSSKQPSYLAVIRCASELIEYRRSSNTWRPT